MCRMVASLYCVPETDVILYVNYTSTKTVNNRNGKKKSTMIKDGVNYCVAISMRFLPHKQPRLRMKLL